MARINIGDIFEIKTSMGKAYLHYIYKDDEIGELVRVLQGLYDERPEDLEKIACSNERYMVFFPLAAANRRKIVERVGNYPADGYSKPKYMRTVHSVRGEFLGWHIVETTSWHRKLVKKLNAKQKKLSPWGIWNATLLIENLESGWSLASWGE